MRRGFFISILVMGVGLAFSGPSVSSAQTGKNMPKAKEFRIERSMPKEALACFLTGATVAMQARTSRVWTATRRKTLTQM